MILARGEYKRDRKSQTVTQKGTWCRRYLKLRHCGSRSTLANWSDSGSEMPPGHLRRRTARAQMPKDNDCLLAPCHSTILNIIPRTNWQNKHLLFFWEIKYAVTPRAKMLRRNINYVPTLKTSNSTAINMPYHNVYMWA